MIQERKFLLLNHRHYHKLKILLEDKKDTWFLKIFFIKKREIFVAFTLVIKIFFSRGDYEKTKNGKPTVAIPEKATFTKELNSPDSLANSNRIVKIKTGSGKLLAFRKKDANIANNSSIVPDSIEKLNSNCNKLEALKGNPEQSILVKKVPNSGELSKFGPGSKGRAKANSPTFPSKGVNGFTDAYGINPQRYNPYRYRLTPKVQKPLQAQNQPDLSKSNMSDATINLEKEEVPFKTPESLTDRVQDVSEAKQLGKLTKKFN